MFSKSKRLISMLICLAMVLAMLPLAVFAATTYTVAGETGLCGVSWDPASNAMTANGDGTYSITFNGIAAGTYQFKVTDGTWTNSWGADGGSQNNKVTVTSACDVTITFDPATLTTTCTGTGVSGVVADMVIDAIYAVGAGAGGFLNDITWDPAAEANKMTQNGKVYTITYADVAAGTYEFKFASNGSWSDSWGSGTAVESGVATGAWYNGNNSSVTVAEDGSTVTLILDLTAMDFKTGNGAMMTVAVNEPAVQPDPSEPSAPSEPEIPSEPSAPTDPSEPEVPSEPTAPTAPTYVPGEDDGPVDEDAFMNVISEGTDVEYGMDTFCVTTDAVITFRVKGFTVTETVGTPAISIEFWANDEYVDGGFFTELGNYMFEVEGGVEYTVYVDPAVVGGTWGDSRCGGTVSYKVVTPAPLGEPGGDQPDVPSEPGADENNPIVFTDNAYSAFVPAGATVWFAHDDSVDLTAGTWAQQIIVSGNTGFSVNHTMGTVSADVEGVVNVAESFCNMVGQYIFAITNNTESDQYYMVEFLDVPAQGGDVETLTEVSDVAVDPYTPWSYTFTAESTGYLTVVIDGDPGWSYKLIYPDGSSTLDITSRNLEDAVKIFEITELGEYTVEAYAYDAALWSQVDGTISCTLTFESVDIGGETVLEDYIISDVMLSIGENSLTMDPNAISTIFEFAPGETGIFSFTVNNAMAVAAYRGAGSWYIFDAPADAINYFEYEITAEGQSIMVGVSDIEGDFIMTIEKIGESVDTEITYEIYEAVDVDQWIDYVVDEDAFVNINVTDDEPDNIYLGADGLYRYGSPYGPVVVINLPDNPTSVNFYEAAHNQPFRVVVTDEDGNVSGIDMTAAVLEYEDAGIIPLNDEIMYLLKTLGNHRGWYDQDILGFYLFNEEIEVDPETAFLVFCGYLEGTEISAPEITDFSSKADGVYFNWNAVDGVEYYRVYVMTSTGWESIGITGGTTYAYNEAKTGVTYTFTVRGLTGGNFSTPYNTTGWSYQYDCPPVITKFDNTAAGIKITWGAVNGADQYRVYAKTSKGWTALTTTADTSYTWSGAKTGLTYIFTVRALNAAGTAFTSSYNTTGWSHKYDCPPTITRFDNTAAGIKITWGAVNGADQYRVFARTSKGWLKLADVTGTSYVWTGAKSGLTYTFTVRALNAAGTAFTSSYNAAGWKQTYVAQPNISKMESTPEGIQITWNAVNGAGKYRVFAKTSKGWLKLADVTGTSYVWTGASLGLTYTFTVRALNAAGTAFVSSYNAAGVKHTFKPVPEFNDFVCGTNGITLKWNAINGAAKYRVFAKTSKGWLKLGDTTGTSFTWTGAKKGYTYTFTIRCVNAAGTAFTTGYNATGWRVAYN